MVNKPSIFNPKDDAVLTLTKCSWPTPNQSISAASSPHLLKIQPRNVLP